MTVETLPARREKDISWQVGADALALKIGGTYQFGMTDETDLAFFDMFEPRGEYEVRCAVVVTGCGISWKRDQQGDAVGVTAVKTLAVDSIYRSD